MAACYKVGWVAIFQLSTLMSNKKFKQQLAAALNPVKKGPVPSFASTHEVRVFVPFTKPTPVKTGSGIALAFSNRRPKKMNKFN